ncbi:MULTISPECIES: GTP-binding protein [unclassified Streptomyces]|uniref:CobW family GTP-binding protein n=1 Tax=unclassified Streptomyces TaxID=2593676 RepID=UPI0001C1AB88|nr:MULTISPECIES: GTP-binding protein [unclassified Streptomyces]MYR67872.1 cobalamin biosynthesis protein CobW [Streptomyces sp. SID4939]MYS00298.1 cobalamin biosynthesis protein CobW [Streptomyces sp. SID4940]MYT67785.1 cobalamin biosynthesis protein CobW [Streptomyces sp. SID8357]MYT86629.1 cobalamin biosynthesis protein CobW [Streptomyces sp. SID8360]MYW41345.1 cobalamin biosynthesis protein CobW [Streptomyces sp. SID1]
MTEDDGKLPVVIVGGLHSEARREVVEGLLDDVPHSVALHHDLATARGGTVRRTVRDTAGERAGGEVPLVNDCACCALREDLIPELERLASDGITRLAVLELWDSVEPKAMAEVIAAHGGEWAEVRGVVTAVDPALVLPYLANGDDLAEAGLAAAASDQRTVSDTWARQLEYASVLALVDSETADEEDRALIRQLHPTARRAEARSDALTRLALAGFDVEAASAAQHPACALLPQEADESGVSTLVWRRHRPFHPERLYEALEDLCCAAARSRGRFWLADRPDTLLSWDAAGGALCVEDTGPWLASLPDAAWETVPPFRRAAAALDWHPEHGDRCQHLVFVSPGLDRDGLTALLDSCLLTDAEYEAGHEAWKSLPPAFDSLLDPVS